MDSHELVQTDEDEAIFTNPVPALVTGLSLMSGALVLAWRLPGQNTVIPALPAIAGALAAGIAVAIAPRTWWVLVGASVAGLLGVWTVDVASWDIGAAYVFWAAAALAALAALLIHLPSLATRATLSFLLLFHFTGILSAITSAQPTPWLPQFLWLHIYRPYLQFVNLNNAYHFYSPEPGPAHMMWFFIEYEPNDDGTRNFRWVKMPYLEDGEPIEYDALGEPRAYPSIEFCRRLAMVEYLNMGTGGAQANNPLYQKFKERRYTIGSLEGIPVYPEIELPIDRQFREPNSVGKIWIVSYARHAARTYKHSVHPEKAVVGVKVYIVEHTLIHYRNFGKSVNEHGDETPGRKLDDPLLYVPTFVGEFDNDGNMKPSCCRSTYNEQGFKVNEEHDPYLYWVIPVLRSPKVSQANVRAANFRINNYMKKHAGDPDWQNQPWENQP